MASLRQTGAAKVELLVWRQNLLALPSLPSYFTLPALPSRHEGQEAERNQERVSTCLGQLGAKRQRVPCAMQQVFIGYSFYIQQRVHDRAKVRAHGNLLSAMCQPGWERGWGEGLHVHMAESLLCSPETPPQHC